MSRRNVLNKYQVWNNLNSTSIIASQESTVDQLDIINYVIKIDPTVNCVIKVEFSGDKNSQTSAWYELDFNTPIILNGAVDTEYTIQIEKHSAFKIRLNAVSNSGTGLINAWITGNNLGA
jgi:spore coat protein U-like protein